MWRTLENTAIFNSENKNTVRIIPKMKPNDSEKVEAKKLKQSDKENTILVKMLSQNHKLLQKLAIISLAFTFSVSTGSRYHFDHTVPQKSAVVNKRDNLSISGYWSTLNQLYLPTHIGQCSENAFYKSTIIPTPTKLYTKFFLISKGITIHLDLVDHKP